MRLLKSWIRGVLQYEPSQARKAFLSRWGWGGLDVWMAILGDIYLHHGSAVFSPKLDKWMEVGASFSDVW